MALIVSDKIREKLATRHNVCVKEVEQCFANRTGKFLKDIRAKHATNPPTLWFIAETDFGRKLKIVFVPDGNNLYLRTGYTPDETELRIYSNKAF